MLALRLQRVELGGVDVAHEPLQTQSAEDASAPNRL
jgi:hypothetical protein